MVNSPRWVMFDDVLYKVKRQNNENFHLENAKHEWDYAIARIDDCTPITDEVATIMIGSM